MNKVFTDNGWKDYVYWQTEDRKTLKKINSLIEDICRNGNEGIGKPEPLGGNLAGFWSRRINDKDRLIYKIDEKNVSFKSKSHEHVGEIGRGEAAMCHAVATLMVGEEK